MKTNRSSRWAGLVLLATSLPAFAAGRPGLKSVATDSAASRSAERTQSKPERSPAAREQIEATRQENGFGHVGEAQYSERQKAYLERRRLIDADQAGSLPEDRESAKEKAKRELLAD